MSSIESSESAVQAVQAVPAVQAVQTVPAVQAVQAVQTIQTIEPKTPKTPKTPNPNAKLLERSESVLKTVDPNLKLAFEGVEVEKTDKNIHGTTAYSVGQADLLKVVYAIVERIKNLASRPDDKGAQIELTHAMQKWKDQIDAAFGVLENFLPEYAPGRNYRKIQEEKFDVTRHLTTAEIHGPAIRSNMRTLIKALVLQGYFTVCQKFSQRDRLKKLLLKDPNPKTDDKDSKPKPKHQKAYKPNKNNDDGEEPKRFERTYILPDDMNRRTLGADDYTVIECLASLYNAYIAKTGIADLTEEVYNQIYQANAERKATKAETFKVKRDAIMLAKREAAKADKPKSDKHKTDKPKSDKPKSDKPKSDKPKSDKPKSDKPKSDKSKPTELVVESADQSAQMETDKKPKKDKSDKSDKSDKKHKGADEKAKPVKIDPHLKFKQEIQKEASVLKKNPNSRVSVSAGASTSTATSTATTDRSKTLFFKGRPFVWTTHTVKTTDRDGFTTTKTEQVRKFLDNGAKEVPHEPEQNVEPNVEPKANLPKMTRAVPKAESKTEPETKPETEPETESKTGPAPIQIPVFKSTLDWRRVITAPPNPNPEVRLVNRRLVSSSDSDSDSSDSDSSDSD